MSEQQEARAYIESVPVLLPDDRVVHIQGYRIGCYTFGPILRVDGVPTWERYAIRSAETGINVATFTDRRVAIRFLSWLWDTYGDLSDTLMRCTARTETPEDAVILDAINARSKHVTRVYGEDGFEQL